MVTEGTPTIQPAKTVEYETPRDLFDKLWKEAGGFDLDPCCRPEHYTAGRVLENGGSIYVPVVEDYSALLARRQRIQRDGLAHPWHGKVWMNPPYGNALRLWVPKAVSEVECDNAKEVWALLPSKTEVRWWQEYLMEGARFEEGHAIGQTWEPPGWHVQYKRSVLKEVRFLPGRLHFGGGEGPARVGNVLVVWRK